MSVSTEMITTIDGYLKELGTQSLFDGDKIRDMFMDLRLMLMLSEVEDVSIHE